MGFWELSQSKKKSCKNITLIISINLIEKININIYLKVK